MTSAFTGRELPELLRSAAVPVWLPWPLPERWLVSGFAGAGDARGDTAGCAVALSGPNPFGGLAEMLIVAEEPGLGLGARFAGLPGPDPGGTFATGAPHAFAVVNKHEFPLWHVDAPHRAAFAGQVMGHWLWLVMWPDTAGLLLVEPLQLTDLREPGQHLDVPYGERSPLLPD
jgi:hypothetical protein